MNIQKFVALKTVSVYNKAMRHQFLHELKTFDALHQKAGSENLVSLVGAYASEGRVTLALE